MQGRGHKLASNYCQDKKAFWQNMLRLCGKRSNTARPIKYQNFVLLSTEGDILRRWREYFKSFGIRSLYLSSREGVTGAAALGDLEIPCRFQQPPIAPLTPREM